MYQDLSENVAQELSGSRAVWFPSDSSAGFVGVVLSALFAVGTSVPLCFSARAFSHISSSIGFIRSNHARLEGDVSKR